MLLVKAFLQRMKLAILDQAFQRGDLAAAGLDRKRRAGFDSFVVQDHGNPVTIGRIATHVCASQPQRLANEVHQQEARFNGNFSIAAVDRNFYKLLVRHNSNPSDLQFLPARSRARVSARMVSSLTRPRLYSSGPRRSELG